MELLAAADNRLQHFPDFAGTCFSSLPAMEAQQLEFDNLIDALQSAFWEIKDPVQSAWREHIAFLYSFMTLIRPRRYVELGVHRGASFLAACQAVQHLQMQTQCVAIDNWIGDPHAGLHEHDIFSQFQNKASKYGNFSGYIQSNFDDALHQFERGSIDLLHIDGFHTQAAVRHDFNQWREKMSDQGVILFHDINEFKTDFGVWRFWREIRQSYPSLEFGHGHGLGVLVVGSHNALGSIVGNSHDALLSPKAINILQVIFGGVGPLTWKSAVESAQLLDTRETLRRSEKLLRDRDSTIQNQERQLQKREAAIQNLENLLQERNATIKNQEQQLQKREAAIQKRETAIQNLENLLQERDIKIDQQNDRLGEQANRIQKLNDRLGEQADRIQKLIERARTQAGRIRDQKTLTNQIREQAQRAKENDELVSRLSAALQRYDESVYGKARRLIRKPIKE